MRSLPGRTLFSPSQLPPIHCAPTLKRRLSRLIGQLGRRVLLFSKNSAGGRFGVGVIRESRARLYGCLRVHRLVRNFPSEASVFADVLLPGAPFAEKDGTFTNTERRIQRVRKAIEPSGEARPDWANAMDLAQRLLNLEDRKPAGPQAGWEYESISVIIEEIAALTPG